jgi:AcrR family transcriptional regulator
MAKPDTETATSPAEVPDGLRSRVRRAMRAEVAAAALELFIAQGFDNTTIDQIAAAAGMSRSSFFRYFPTKEDTVLGDLAGYGQQILHALIERPATEPIWTALRMALEVIIDINDVTRTRQASRMFISTPALKARQYEKTMAWQALLLPEIARRLGLSEPQADDPRPAALTSCALACLDAAVTTWATSDTATPLAELLDMAMDSVSPQTTL